MIQRRELVLRSAAALAALALPQSSRAQPAQPELRIGYQKSSILALVRAQGLVERRYRDTKITWVEFPFGPPLLEAMNAGRIDYGYTGNAPPIFAQAARADFNYVAALPARGDNVAILVAKDGPLQQIVDLKGRKVGVGKGSSGHEFLLAALESAGLDYSAITPVYLAPADGAVALARGAIDAWSIWDPYLAVAETTRPVRPLPIDSAIGRQNAFFLASKTLVERHPEIVLGLNDDVAATARWARTHRSDAAKLFAKATGVDLVAERLAVSRTDFIVSPITEAIVEEQQHVADRFLAIGLIPHPVRVKDIAWLGKANVQRVGVE